MQSFKEIGAEVILNESKACHYLKDSDRVIVAIFLETGLPTGGSC